MKKIGKKIGKYLIIVLLLLLGLACAGVLYLFFVPGSNLFSITYISNNSFHESTKYDTTNVSKVVLNSHDYKVLVKTTTEKKFAVKVHNNSFGFVLVKNSAVSISDKKVDDVVEFTVKEPTGLAVQNNSYIELHIPESLEIDLHLTNNGAKTIISDEKLIINDLTYKTTYGNADLKALKLTGDLDLNLGNSTFTVGSQATSSNNDVALNITTGKFDGSQATFGDINIKSNERGVILAKECNNFNEEVTVAGGRIELTKVGHALIKTSDTIVKIKEVTNNVIIELTKSGSVEIDSIAGISDIKTAEGSVTINKATSSLLVLETSHGNITVSNAYNLVEAITSHGTITVYYAKEAKSYSESNIARSLSADISGNGKIVATGVEHVNVSILDDGRAELYMNNVLGNNAITGKNGSVYVKVNKDAKYTLKTTSTSGSVRVNLTQIPNHNGYTDLDHPAVNVNCNAEDAEATANKLSISTNNGSIIVLDTNF